MVQIISRTHAPGNIFQGTLHPHVKRRFFDMGQVTTLIEIVNICKDLSDADTIYVQEPWMALSVAIVATDPLTGCLPTDAKILGFRYFLEVSVANEFLDGWCESLKQRPTLQEKCQRLIIYAINDA